MKKHAFLMLLPFALVITGCSGSLKKASIFNDKFLKMNCVNFEEKHEFEIQNDVVLDLGEGVTPVQNATYDDILDLSKTDGSSGFYNLSTRKMVLAVDAYKAGSTSIEKDPNFDMRVFAGTKVVEEKDVIFVFDEYGNQLYTGKGGVLTVDSEDAWNVKENTEARLDIFVDGISVAHAFYGLNGVFKEVLTPEQFYAKYPYSFMGDNLLDYGHEELIMNSVHSDGEERYFVFNTKKEKYVSSFTIPDAISGGTYQIGDYIFYQIQTPVNEREEKYDYAPNQTTKRNVDTYRVNYLNGKTEKVNTNLIFSSIAGANSQAMFNEKGILKYYFLSGVRHFEKDKSYSPVTQNIIVDEKFNVVADVSGINLTQLEQFGDYYRIGNTVYDSQLREVGYLQDMVYGYAPRIVETRGLYGLVDHTGKYLIEPMYDVIDICFENEDEYYVLQKDDVTKFVKLTANEELKELVSFSSEKYGYDHQTSSWAHYVYENLEDSKMYVLSVLDGSFTPQFEGETGDIAVCLCESESAVNNTLYTDALVYKRGETYHALYNSTKTTYSIPEYYANLFK